MTPRCSAVPRRTVAFVLGSALTLSVVESARAQSSIEDEFSVQRFDPAPGPRNYFSTRGARIQGDLAWSAGLFLNYANEPFVVVSCRAVDNCDDASAVSGRDNDIRVVENLATADFLGSISLADRIQIGLKVPVSIVEGDGLQNDGTPNQVDLTPGLGDITVEGKARLHGEIDDPVVVGGALFLTAPTGHASADGKYIGDSTPTVGLRGIFDGAQGPFYFGGNLAGILRGSGRVGSTEIGSEFRYNVAAAYALSPVIRVLVDGFGATKFSSKNGTNSLEVDLGAQFTPLFSPITISGGGGVGVIEGIGVPNFRVILGATYTYEGRDKDQDGVEDSADSCPTEPEDKDGYEDTDGCPDYDNDGDTIRDDADKCPTEPEDPDGFEDTDGCPELDNDKDGVDDNHDQCRDEPETRNGFRDEDGCPDEADTDGDGVPDGRDKCPQQAEDTDGFEDTDGCPDLDNDGDGIPDDQDECVDQPETKNGFEDEDGCPDEKKKRR